MDNKVIKSRLTGLRLAMEQAGIDYYMIPDFELRKYYCGFTGSNGNLLVWQEGAGLWTDGRYFIQAAKQLEGTGVTLFKMGEEGVPEFKNFLRDHMKSGQTFGFDGKVVNAAEGIRYEKVLEDKEIVFAYDRDLAGENWRERPQPVYEQTLVLSREIAGKSVEEKVADVRERLDALGAEAFVLEKEDDLAWLFNIRSAKVGETATVPGCAYVDRESVKLFLHEEALTQETCAHLQQAGVELGEYRETIGYLTEVAGTGRKILADAGNCKYGLFKLLENQTDVINKANPTELLKAVKNPVEQEYMRKYYLLDSVAVTKFIYWLKQNIGKIEITELSAADYLEQLRREIPGFLGLSFPTIAGYKGNAAMMHYRATREEHAVLAPEGMLLVDSGGQYLGATTDVTRTIVLGEISEEIKKGYTATAAGMLQLSAAKWLHGCTGRNLDILARGPLWDLGIDYKCGTGHGIGYILNVHEGPQNIRWRYLEGMPEAVLEAGMDTSNEPGVYVEGSYGIRIENILLAQNGVKNSDGQFMYFETLTYVPIDLDAIDVKCLTEPQRRLLNQYHREVYERVSPYLSEEEKVWLARETREI